MAGPSAVALFPAAVTLPDGTVHQPARLDTHQGTVRAWALVDGFPTLVASWPLDQLTSRVERGRRTFTTLDGALITGAKGCGCSHPLKRFRPPVEQPA